MITYGTEHITLDDFKKTYEKAEPGDTIVYALGDLALSRSIGPEGKELNRVGRYAMHLAEYGSVTLTQRMVPETWFRFGGGRCCEYRATKCSPKSSILTRLPHSSLLADALATV